MQTTPCSARTSAPKQFSATFENQGSGIIYNPKYILAIGKKTTMRWNAPYCAFRTKQWSSCSFEMQTTPRSARTSEPAHFSATFENGGSGTIYNTKYMFAIGKKLRMWNCITMENPLRTKSHISHTVSIKHNVLKCSLLSIPHKVMI